MNYGHFILVFLAGSAAGISAATPHLYIALGGLAAMAILGLLLIAWMGYCDRATAAKARMITQEPEPTALSPEPSSSGDSTPLPGRPT